MLTTVILNFFIAALGSLAIFLVSIRLQGIGSFSAPFFVIIVGIVCAAASVHFGYISTIVVLAFYAISEARDVMETRKMVINQSKEENDGGQ